MYTEIRVEEDNLQNNIKQATHVYRNKVGIGQHPEQYKTSYTSIQK
jgi:hypothetical protein